MKILKWAGMLLVAGVIGWLAAMTIHASYAKGYPDGGMAIIPRGPGGPPVVIKDDEAAPRWKIVVTMKGPDGEQSLTYAPDKQIRWYATLEECDAARKGGDAKLAHGLKLMHQQLEQTKIPVKVTVACKPDNSV